MTIIRTGPPPQSQDCLGVTPSRTAGRTIVVEVPSDCHRTLPDWTTARSTGRKHEVRENRDPNR